MWLRGFQGTLKFDLPKTLQLNVQTGNDEKKRTVNHYLVVKNHFHKLPYCYLFGK